MNQTKIPSKGKYKTPRLIQRLIARTKDCTVRFGERYQMDYMGSTEFELGLIAARLRELATRSMMGEVMVNGRFILVLFNPVHYDLQGVECVLNKLYHNEFQLKEPSLFNDDYRKRYKEISPNTRIDAWFDIQHGLFWTWQRINIKDVQRNIRISVEYMDGRRQDKISNASKIVVTEEDACRRRLIEQGVLRPRSNHRESSPS